MKRVRRTIIIIFIFFTSVCLALYFSFRYQARQEMNAMSRIFITGSSDGIGQAGAKLLADQGHKVYLHARNEARAKEAHTAVPKAEGVLIGDLSTISGTKSLAESANKIGTFDCVIHNAGLGPSQKELTTADGFAATFAVNSLAPYILTSLMHKPRRMLYLSSSLHTGGSADLSDPTWQNRRWSSNQAYGDSKLHDILLANAVSRHWPDVQSCSMDPGWIKTKMGGGGAPGKVGTPGKAMADFAVGNSSITGSKSGVYFNPQGARTPKRDALDEGKQEEFLKVCESLSGVKFPKP